MSAYAKVSRARTFARGERFRNARKYTLGLRPYLLRKLLFRLIDAIVYFLDLHVARTDDDDGGNEKVRSHA